jgi:phosphate:Na+ symporter
VNFHTAFNLILALAFLPFTGIIAKIVTKAFPDKTDAEDPGQPRYLNVKEMDTPAIALASAARETLRMADALQGMMEDTIKAFRTNSESFVNTIRDKDDVIDRLYDAIKRYMARLTQEYMDKKDAQRYVQILTFATNLEHAGDVIDKNLMPLALKKIRHHGSFSTEGFREIEEIHNQVLDSIKLAQDVFVTGNLDLARRMLEEKEEIRKKETDASVSHIDRLRDGVPETIATTSLHLDIIRDLRRINSYMCTAAYALLEEKGQLNATRLKANAP